MDWCDFISGIYESRPAQPGITGKPQFYAAASTAEIADAEDRLNARFPASIRSLLLTTNGVMDMMAIDGGEWFDSMWLLWTVAEIIEQNRLYRRRTEEGASSRDFRKLVFFADAGCDGYLFAFPMSDDRMCASRVAVWYPIMDELVELAPSLEDFLRGWLTGAITLTSGLWRDRKMARNNREE